MPSGTNFKLSETAVANNPAAKASQSNTTAPSGLGTSYVVATLPSSAPANATAVVTDATAFTPGSAPAGGGALVVPVFYNAVTAAWNMF
jgi:hypothetical protein